MAVLELDYLLDERNRKSAAKELGREVLLDNLRKMLLIRNFERRGEAAYQQGKIGGFFHTYIGQEAIAAASLQAFGPNNWYAGSYRCHALALLLGVTPTEIMAEFFGKATGNARGRGGSMHLYSERLMGGSGIVGGQVPLAAGAALSIKYRRVANEASICYLGDGAVAQGAFHESLNMLSLWNLPCIVIIENNHWGMGTAVNRALAVQRLAETKAPGYGMQGYTFDGMDFLTLYRGFKAIYDYVLKESRPVLVEVVTERFRGHSISDPGLYRSKEALEVCKKRDPILLLFEILKENKWIDDSLFEKMDAEERDRVIEAVEEADRAPFPDPATLEEDVFAP